MKNAKIYFEGNLVSEIEHDNIKRLVDFEMNTKEFYLYLNEKEVAFFGSGYSFVLEDVQKTKCDPAFTIRQKDIDTVMNNTNNR